MSRQIDLMRTRRFVRSTCSTPLDCVAGERGACPRCHPHAAGIRSVKMRLFHASRRGFEIPAWVRSAGLVDDFCDIAADQGEEAAASHCRYLKRAAEGF